MTHSYSVDSPAMIQGRHLRLHLEQTADRFTMRVVLVTELSSEIPVLQSWDEAEDQAWPSSPPIQQVHAQRIDDRDCLTGVGMAGRSHWSIAIMALDSTDGASIESADRAAFDFDVACRTQEPPVWLGSSWTAGWIPSAEGDLRTVDRERISSLDEQRGSVPVGGQLAIEGLHVWIRPSADDGQWTVDEQPDRGSIWGIRPQNLDFTSLPATFRWRFRLGLRPAADPVD